ncbi:probable WRKY transcription factor 65 isoform X2 [Argentina anserina]|uniref:probable WRKY transcription factor 65 isoform X2 n=1 Tax=Argentina anserina TaxID=57926 RepID=UPI0021762A2D|nr:probable WRKY transcription factor 65 isoform X2 [Potentilla anserina]
MDSPTFFNKHFMSDIDHDDYNNNTTTSTPENSSGSPPPPPPPAFNDVVFSKIAAASSPKKSRRALQKRVVSIPIKENSNTNTPPPSDSWAWRKYGQKPIKGSPYPRGYYRCSSSKGCPARKQVERSRADPTMLMITYSSEHNHPWPASRNHHGSKSEAKITEATREDEETAAAAQPDPEPEERQFADLAGDEGSALVIIPSVADEFGWFAADIETTSSRVLESPIFAESGGADMGDVAGMVFPMGEEDESLFADLGELPECSLVFRHRRVGGGGVGPQAQIC